MKKTIAILAVLICAFSAFAAGNRLNLNTTPYIMQISYSPIAGEEPIGSIYGAGVGVFYSRAIAGDWFYAELGGAFNAVHMTDSRPPFAAASAFAGFGFRLGDDAADLYLHFGGGCDYLMFDGMRSLTTIAKAGAGLEVAYGRDMFFRVGCDWECDFAQSDDGMYFNYRVLPIIGFAHEF